VVRIRRKQWLIAGLAVAIALGVAGYVLSRHASHLLRGIAFGNGRLEATEVDIATKFAGRLGEVRVREGDKVAAGDVVARMDATVLEARVRRAEAELRRARDARALAAAVHEDREMRRALAARDLERSLSLFENRTVAEQQVDRDRTTLATAQSACEAAKAQVADAEAAIEVARAELEALRAELDESVLRAPRGGRVLYRLAEPGEVLPAGGRILTVVDLSDIYMTVFLSETDAGQARIGGDAEIVLDALPDRVVGATVSFVAPEAQFTPKEVETPEQRERLVFRVKLQVIAPDDSLYKPGMPGVAYIRLAPDAEWPPHPPSRR
jgi:HlyD family secretion protein